MNAQIINFKEFVNPLKKTVDVVFTLSMTLTSEGIRSEATGPITLTASYARSGTMVILSNVQCTSNMQMMLPPGTEFALGLNPFSGLAYTVFKTTVNSRFVIL